MADLYLCAPRVNSAEGIARAHRNRSLERANRHFRRMVWSAVQLSLAVLSLLIPLGAQDTRTSKPAPHIAARVDPRTELFSILFRLAKNPEFNRPNAMSSYSAAVDAWFEEYADHPAVALAAEERTKHGIAFDAVPGLALHVENLVTFEERVPLEAPECILDDRWTAGRARAFLAAAKSFKEASRFDEFMASQTDYQDRAARALEAAVNGHGILEYCEAFFGPRDVVEIGVIAGLLNGGNNFGTSVRLADGRWVLTPVLGSPRRDAEGRPVWTGTIVPIVVHEFSHTWINPAVERAASQLDPLGEKLHATKREIMNRQAYTNGRTVLCESFVRAATVRYWTWRGDAAMAEKQLREEVSRGFEWTPIIVPIFERSTPATLESSLVEAARAVEAWLAERGAPTVVTAPTVMSMTPTNGSKEVDASATKAIVIEFSKAMQPNAWSVVGGGPKFPKISGPLSYDESGTRLTIPVSLEQGKTYEFGLNSRQHRNFKSRDGGVLEPIAVTFTTKKE